MNGIMCANELISNEISQRKNLADLSFVIQWIEVIRASSQALNEMIDNTLTFCKLYTRNVTFELKPVNIQELIAPIKQIISTYPRSPRVVVEFDDRNWNDLWAFSNQAPLHQILLNLLTNALKFTENGKVKVSVRCVQETKQIEIEVKDTGIGMNQAFIEYGLFEPFEQEISALLGTQRGVGLGMALSKYMVDGLKGQLFVSSVKGHGTTFTVLLPMTEPLFKCPINNNHVNSNLKSLPVNALIVDDNEINRKVMRHLLEHLGFTCKLAESGEEAILTTSKLKDGELDVVFMDVFMPGIGGIEASSRILSFTNSWKLPPFIVACTADTSEKTLTECAEIGITKFVHKPINKEALKELLEFLQQRKLQ